MFIIKIGGYAVSPDNGSTWSVSKAYVNKKGEDNVRAPFYPKSLQRALERVREEELKDVEFCGTVDEAIVKLAEYDKKFLEELRSALKEAGHKADPTT